MSLSPLIAIGGLPLPVGNTGNYSVFPLIAIGGLTLLVGNTQVIILRLH